MQFKQGGTPIKDRGIRWEEAYGDKSAYLKQEFEKQVGPGSYFRWEGHDSTTGSDYYAVVTPGFSKKHGFHFFAALRKIPADHGASGKKFKYQAEALDYAYETWRVPPPETKPHKPYIDKDLQGKPIVMENVHDAATDVFMTKTSKIIIDVADAIEKTAMAVQNMGGAAVVIPNHFGPLDYAAHARHVAVMNTIADPGIGHNSGKQWLMIDRKNQMAGNYEGPAGKTSAVRSGIATCEPPSEQLWNMAMGEAGQPIYNPLFKKNYKKEITFTPPALQAHPNYEVIRFDKIMMVHPTIDISFSKKGMFDTQFPYMVSSLKSKLKPDEGVKITNVHSPVKRSKDAPDQLEAERGNFVHEISMPIDLYVPLKEQLAKSGIASLSDLSRYDDANAALIYNWFQQPANGGLATPEAIEKAKQTPVIEKLSLNKGQLVVYDGLGYPIGIKVQRNKHFDKETKGDAAGAQENLEEDIKFEFAPGVVDRWLQQSGGNLSQLRKMLASNQIEIQRQDCIDANTCAPMNRHVYSDYPVLDEVGRPQVQDGKLQTQHRQLFGSYPNPIDSNEVRVYSPEERREKIITLNDYQKQYGSPIAENQEVHGLPVIAENAFYYVAAPDGTLKEYDARSTRMYDPNSKGKVKNGAAYVLIAEVERSTPKKENVSKFENLEQDAYGWYGGTRKHEGGLVNVRDTSFVDKNKKRRPMTVADLKEKQSHLNNLFAILTPSGQYLQMPPHDLSPEDPRYQEHPAVKYMASPQNVISGYSYINTKMYDPVPLTTNMPKNKKPIELTWMTNRTGDFRADIDPTTGQERKLVITADDMRLGQASGRKNKVYYRKFKTLMQHIQAKFGLTEDQIGPYADITDEDIHAAYDKVKEIKKKVASGIPMDRLTPEEQVYAQFPPEGNTIPTAALEMMSKISTDPSKYQPRKGTLYQLSKIGSDSPIEAHPHVFVTLEKANEFKTWMETTRELGGGGHPAGSLHIVPHHDQDLVVSQARATAAGKPKQLMTVPENYSPPESPEEQKQQDLEQQQQQEQAPQPPEDPGISVKAPVDIPDMPTATSPGEPKAAPVFEPPWEKAKPEAPAQVFQPPWEKAKPEAAPAPTPAAAPAPVPAPVFRPPWEKATTGTPPAPPLRNPFQTQTPPPAASVPPARRKRPWEASSINKLIKLADKFDQQGKHSEADAIDRLIRLTIERSGGPEERS